LQWSIDLCPYLNPELESYPNVDIKYKFRHGIVKKLLVIYKSGLYIKVEALEYCAPNEPVEIMSLSLPLLSEKELPNIILNLGLKDYPPLILT
jgi:hypothetical protein